MNNSLKKLFILSTFLFLFQNSNAQEFAVEINIFQNSSYLEIEAYQLRTIKEFKKDKTYRGISKKWTHLLEFEFQSKIYQVPIDQRVRTLTLIDNPKAEGFCNRLLYWTSNHTANIIEHGNGCTDMNEMIINDGKKPEPRTIFEGTRVIPFVYKEKIKH